MKLQKYHIKSFRLKYIDIKTVNPTVIKTKSNISVAFPSVTFAFSARPLVARPGVQVKLCTQRIGHYKLNLSKPIISIT